MSYVIFSIDRADNPMIRNLFHNYIAAERKLGILEADVVSAIGRYNGRGEYSYICSRRDWEVVFERSHWVRDQESILCVSSGNKMETWLEYLPNNMSAPPGTRVFMGCMHQVCAEEAFQSPAYTYRPDMNAYWIAKMGNPDGSYERSVAKYRDHVEDAVDVAAE